MIQTFQTLFKQRIQNIKQILIKAIRKVEEVEQQYMKKNATNQKKQDIISKIIEKYLKDDKQQYIVKILSKLQQSQNEKESLKAELDQLKHKNQQLEKNISKQHQALCINKQNSKFSQLLNGQQSPKQKKSSEEQILDKIKNELQHKYQSLLEQECRKSNEIILNLKKRIMQLQIQIRDKNTKGILRKSFENKNLQIEQNLDLHKLDQDNKISNLKSLQEKKIEDYYKQYKKKRLKSKELEQMKNKKIISPIQIRIEDRFRSPRHLKKYN